MSLNVSLTPYLEEFVRQTIASGRFDSADALIGTALRLFEEREEWEREQATKLEWLQAAIQKGLDSGPMTPFDMEEIKRLGRERLLNINAKP